MKRRLSLCVVEGHGGHIVRASAASLETTSACRVLGVGCWIRAVYPDVRDPQLVRRRDVVVEALGDVRPVVLGDPHARGAGAEVARARFVARDLLCRDHGVEVEIENLIRLFHVPWERGL